MDYIKILKWLAPYIIVAVVASGVIWKIQSWRMERIKSQLAVKTQELVTCQDVNKVNQETINALKDEIKRINSTCNNRLKIKENTIANIAKIDSLTQEGKGEKKDNTDDPLLDMLNSMFK